MCWPHRVLEQDYFRVEASQATEPPRRVYLWLRAGRVTRPAGRGCRFARDDNGRRADGLLITTLSIVWLVGGRSEHSAYRDGTEKVAVHLE
jgi:hypothetical protein